MKGKHLLIIRFQALRHSPSSLSDEGKTDDVDEEEDGKLRGPALVRALADLRRLASKQFLSVLQQTVQQQLARAEEATSAASAAALELAPSPSSSALLALLKDILSSEMSKGKECN